MSESLWQKAKFTQCAVMAIHTPSEAPDQLRIHVRAPGSHVGYRLVLGSVPGFWSDWHAEDEKENNGVREHFLTLNEAESLANELLRQVQCARFERKKLKKADQGGGK